MKNNYNTKCIFLYILEEIYFTPKYEDLSDKLQTKLLSVIDLDIKLYSTAKEIFERKWKYYCDNINRACEEEVHDYNMKSTLLHTRFEK